jgi:hypothetical protein
MKAVKSEQPATEPATEKRPRKVAKDPGVEAARQRKNALQDIVKIDEQLEKLEARKLKLTQERATAWATLEQANKVLAEATRPA